MTEAKIDYPRFEIIPIIEFTKFIGTKVDEDKQALHKEFDTFRMRVSSESERKANDSPTLIFRDQAKETEVFLSLTIDQMKEARNAMSKAIEAMER